MGKESESKIETEEADFLSSKEMKNGIVCTVFTYEGNAENIYPKDGEDVDVSFTLETNYEELKVSWFIEAMGQYKSLTWSKVKLLSCNQNIYGNYIVKGQYHNDSFSDAFGSMPYERKFKVRDDMYIKITIFIYHRPQERVLMSSVVEDYGKLLENKESSDLTFVVQNQEIKAHSQVLAARSDGFATILKSKAAGEKIEVNDVEPYIFKLLLKFVYCGIFNAVDTDDLLKLVVAADKYSLDSLVKICEERLIFNLSVDNVVSVLKASYVLKTDVMKNKCLEFISKNMDKVVLEV